MTYILIIWLWHTSTTAVVVDRYSSITACESAGAVWEQSQKDKGYNTQFAHHACLPHQ